METFKITFEFLKFYTPYKKITLTYFTLSAFYSFDILIILGDCTDSIIWLSILTTICSYSLWSFVLSTFTFNSVLHSSSYVFNTLLLKMPSFMIQSNLSNVTQLYLTLKFVQYDFLRKDFTSQSTFSFVLVVREPYC